MPDPMPRSSPEFVILGMARSLRMIRTALTRQTWQHRCPNGVGGCRAISEYARHQALKQIERWCPPKARKKAKRA